jgi:hypothetical protein
MDKILHLWSLKVLFSMWSLFYQNFHPTSTRFVQIAASGQANWRDERKWRIAAIDKQNGWWILQGRHWKIKTWTLCWLERISSVCAQFKRIRLGRKGEMESNFSSYWQTSEELSGGYDLRGYLKLLEDMICLSKWAIQMETFCMVVKKMRLYHKNEKTRQEIWDFRDADCKYNYETQGILCPITYPHVLKSYKFAPKGRWPGLITLTLMRSLIWAR